MPQTAEQRAYWARKAAAKKAKDKPKPRRCGGGGHHMVWAAGPDGVVRDCACRDCGQAWELVLEYDGHGNIVSAASGWRPVYD